jgi:hypothetical protein
LAEPVEKARIINITMIVNGVDHGLPGPAQYGRRYFSLANGLLADKGYDADWFQVALSERHIEVCMPQKSNRKIQIPYDKALCHKR